MIPADVCAPNGVDVMSSVFISLFIVFIVADLCVNSRALSVVMRNTQRTLKV